MKVLQWKTNLNFSVTLKTPLITNFRNSSTFYTFSEEREKQSEA